MGPATEQLDIWGVPDSHYLLGGEGRDSCILRVVVSMLWGGTAQG